MKLSNRAGAPHRPSAQTYNSWPAVTEEVGLAKPSSADEFILTHYRSLLRTTIAITGSAADADDLLHDVLVKVLINWSMMEEVDNPLAYVRRSLIRRHMDRARSQRRSLARENLNAAKPNHIDCGQEISETLLLRLQELPIRQRAVIVLRYLDDLADSEISELLGISSSTVRVTARNAKRNLRAIIERQENERG